MDEVESAILCHFSGSVEIFQFTMMLCLWCSPRMVVEWVLSYREISPLLLMGAVMQSGLPSLANGSGGGDVIQLMVVEGVLSYREISPLLLMWVEGVLSYRERSPLSC